MVRAKGRRTSERGNVGHGCYEEKPGKGERKTYGGEEREANPEGQGGRWINCTEDI